MLPTYQTAHCFRFRDDFDVNMDENDVSDMEYGSDLDLDSGLKVGKEANLSGLVQVSVECSTVVHVTQGRKLLKYLKELVQL